MAGLLGLLAGCQATPPPGVVETSAVTILRPLSKPLSEDAKRGRTYVPIYSSIPWGFDRRVVDLAATLSIRNVSLTDAVVIEAVRYYDSSGKEIREYLKGGPAELPPMASVEFVVERRDRTGGPGANFLVDWAVAANGEEPFIEAVQVGQQGNAGISFTTNGHPVRRR